MRDRLKLLALVMVTFGVFGFGIVNRVSAQAGCAAAEGGGGVEVGEDTEIPTETPGGEEATPEPIDESGQDADATDTTEGTGDGSDSEKPGDLEGPKDPSATDPDGDKVTEDGGDTDADETATGTETDDDDGLPSGLTPIDGSDVPGGDETADADGTSTTTGDGNENPDGTESEPTTVTQEREDAEAVGPFTAPADGTNEFFNSGY